MKRLSCEVVVFPTNLMGELVEGKFLQPIPKEMITGEGAEGLELHRLPLDDLFPTIRASDVSWGRTLYGVTLGAPHFVLMYRADLFAKLGIKPPTTWKEYQETAELLANREKLGELAPPADKSWFGALEPCDAKWAGSMLLTRAASYVRTDHQLYTLFDLEKMTPRIATPPYVRAAEEMAAVASFGEKDATPQSVRAAFLAGQCGMAITWPAPSADETKLAIGFAELPGSIEAFNFQEDKWVPHVKEEVTHTAVYGAAGRIAAVTREARMAKSAFRILAWLSKEETVQDLGPIGDRGTIFARTQLAAPTPWLPAGLSSEAAQQYANVCDTIFSRPVWVPLPRFPGQAEYMAPLNAATQAIITKQQPAQDALNGVVEKWNELTKKRELNVFRREYQRSVGNDS